MRKCIQCDKLQKKLCIPCNAVHDTIVRYQETGFHNDHRRIGRPKATSAAESNLSNS